MDLALRILVLVSTAWFLIVVFAFGSSVRKNVVGTAPIARPAFLLAKISLTVSFLMLILAAVFWPARLSGPLTILCAALLLAGSLVFTAAFFRLGTNLRMGLPAEETALVTSGIYRITRNPIYVAVYFFLAASLIYAFSWWNLLAVLTAVILHHRIILAEERFLSQRFEQYDAYRAQVRRYL